MVLRRYPRAALATRNKVSEKDACASQWVSMLKLVIETVLYIQYSVSVGKATSSHC